jgi:hypothetical protein
MKQDIQQVAKKLAESIDVINPVFRAGDEYYFEFPCGIFWSITKWERDGVEIYSLYLYPVHHGSLESLFNNCNRNSFCKEGEDYKAYNTEDIPNVEFATHLAHIFSSMQEKIYGISKIFESVLNIESAIKEQQKIEEKRRAEQAQQKKEAEDVPF